MTNFHSSSFLIPTLLLNILALSCFGGDTRNEVSTTIATTADVAAETTVSGTANESTAGVTSGPMTPASTSNGSESSGWSVDQGSQEGGDCDNWAQDCPEGQKCVAYASRGGIFDATKCVNMTGEDKPGDQCTSEGILSGIDSCVKGAVCWDLDQNGIGTCQALCTGTPKAPKCEPPATCSLDNGTLIVCLGCNPLLQDCADPSDGCYQLNNGFVCAPDVSGDKGQANDPCEFLNQCNKGLRCAEVALAGKGCEWGSSGCGTPFCKFTESVCPNDDNK